MFLSTRPKPHASDIPDRNCNSKRTTALSMPELLASGIRRTEGTCLTLAVVVLVTFCEMVQDVFEDNALDVPHLRRLRRSLVNLGMRLEHLTSPGGDSNTAHISTTLESLKRNTHRYSQNVTAIAEDNRMMLDRILCYVQHYVYDLYTSDDPDALPTYQPFQLVQNMGALHGLAGPVFAEIVTILRLRAEASDERFTSDLTRNLPDSTFGHWCERIGGDVAAYLASMPELPRDVDLTDPGPRIADLLLGFMRDGCCEKILANYVVGVLEDILLQTPISDFSEPNAHHDIAKSFWILFIERLAHLFIQFCGLWPTEPPRNRSDDLDWEEYEPSDLIDILTGPENVTAEDVSFPLLHIRDSTCGICGESTNDLRRPVVCIHTFCRECLDTQLATRHPMRYKCAICRADLIVEP